MRRTQFILICAIITIVTALINLNSKPFYNESKQLIDKNVFKGIKIKSKTVKKKHKRESMESPKESRR